MLMSDPLETPYEDTQQFQNFRFRIIYDVLVDSMTDYQHTAEHTKLILAIHKAVKSKPFEETEDTQQICQGLKHIIVNSIIRKFELEKYCSIDALEDDHSDQYKKLVKYCCSLAVFNRKKIEHSLKKNFLEYYVDDYTINLATSYADIMYVKYMCELLEPLIEDDDFIESDSRKIFAKTGYENKLERSGFFTVGSQFVIKNNALKTIFSTELDADDLKEELIQLKRKGVVETFYIYSMTEIFDLIEEMVGEDAHNYASDIKAIEKSTLASELEPVFFTIESSFPRQMLAYRNMTKYEMMCSSGLDTVTAVNLEEWRKSMARLMTRIKHLCKFLQA